MGIDVGFDMVPRLSRQSLDQEKWNVLLDIIRDYYEDDNQVEVKSNCIEFHAGEHPILPLQGHKFLRFSSKVSGRIATETGVADYLRKVTSEAKKIFGVRICTWNEAADNFGFYDWRDIHASSRTFDQSAEPAGPIAPDASTQYEIDRIESSFQITKVPGKGKGMVARRGFTSGTLIISEEPLLTLPNLPFEQLDGVVAAKLKPLSREDQRRFLALANSIHESFPFGGTARTNILPCGLGDQTGAVYPTISRINHSCDPNTYTRILDDKHSQGVNVKMSQGQQQPSPAAADDYFEEDIHTETEHAESKEQNLEAATPPGVISDDETIVVDPNLVSWDGPQDPENPKNWPNKTKWSYTIAVSVFTFISPISSTMVAPALTSLGADLKMHSEIEMSMALSIFVLGYAVGPLFFGPASEMYGRVLILQLTNLWYLAWNLACGFAQNPAQLFIFRFLAGIGGSAPISIGGGAISDTWNAEERGRAIGIYTLAPILGPVVGPIAGAFIAQYTTWRWVFWSTSIAAVGIQIVGLVWLRESHPGTLLRWKRNRLFKESGNEKLHTGGKVETPLRKFGNSLVRPTRMLTTQPIIMVIAVYMAYLFGTMYLILSTFPLVWSERYDESKSVGGLNYLSIAIGSFGGIFLCFFFVDRIYRNLKAKNGGVGRPEFRTPAMFIGSITVTIGLFWYGWSVQARLHWIMPNIGIIFFSAGTMACLQGMQTFIVDSYSTYAASALAAGSFLRSLAGFGFPLFAPYLYADLGYGWGTSVLAFISIGVGIPAPVLFWRYGPRLRAMSKYAAG
ncbi:hypothetical protein G7046_g3146 [Stylonectria norvegica]|nr:hypothetical protein G7046_g3146 [Stylonectria norvegica]